MTKNIIPGALLLVLAGLSSCKKDAVNTLETGNFSDTTGALKAAASFPIGIAIDYTPFKNDAGYRATVAREAVSTTFGYQMKHGALVNSAGALDFTKADELYNLATTAGLQVFGHTLAWHQNQNAVYMSTITGGGSGPAPVNLLLNGTFEAGNATSFTNWSAFNGGASISAATAAAEVHGGTRSLKVLVAASGNPWSIQLASDEINTTTGTTYRISFWIKSATTGGKMRISTQGGGDNYLSDNNTTTDWAQVTQTFAAKGTKTRVLFDIGSTANTYFVDDVSVVDAISGTPPTGPALVTAVSNALNDFITKMVTHYKGKVKAWDVVNEPMADGSSGLRVRSNSTVASGATDVFFWSDYLGRDYALKAFQYAQAADPDALLFINDYNLESNTAKVDSLINYVKELKTKGAKIDGIGTQMHIDWNTTRAGIDAAFQKIAATGLKVRVSELDVKVNPLNKPGFTASPVTLGYQAAMYQYVVSSYIRHVPAAQRHGITIWGVADQDSWLATGGKLEYPLLFNNNYSKKPAYAGFLQALK
jgi:endo-1,4-beta-xylanase